MRIKDLFENENNTIEEQARSVGDSISEVSDSKLQKAIKAGYEILNGTGSDEDFEAFYAVAGNLVEPHFDDDNAREDYQDLMDNDMENWVGWIKSTFGDDWGMIAKVVAEYGY